jgi:hypothetical protein
MNPQFVALAEKYNLTSDPATKFLLLGLLNMQKAAEVQPSIFLKNVIYP